MFWWTPRSRLTMTAGSSDANSTRAGIASHAWLDAEPSEATDELAAAEVLGEEESEKPGRLVRHRDPAVVDEPVDRLPARVLSDELAGEGGGRKVDAQMAGMAVAAAPGKEAVYARAAGGVVVRPGVQKVLGACAEGDVLGVEPVEQPDDWVTWARTPCACAWLTRRRREKRRRRRSRCQVTYAWSTLRLPGAQTCAVRVASQRSRPASCSSRAGRAPPATRCMRRLSATLAGRRLSTVACVTGPLPAARARSAVSRAGRRFSQYSRLVPGWPSPRTRSSD